jgi:hypothetical protein
MKRAAVPEATVLTVKQGTRGDASMSRVAAARRLQKPWQLQIFLYKF